jgi:sugar/nucleoside kinase (ribokinase family)
VLSEIDILLPNAAEAMRLSGATSVVDAAEALAAHGPLVAVKNGAAGALCHTGTTLSRTNGIRVSPVDTVGAGDSFDAGFVAAKLRGMSDRQALDVAAVCGALSTTASGGTASQPTWEDVMSHVQKETRA